MTTSAGPIQGRTAWRRTLDVKQRYLAGGDPDRLPPTRCGVRPEIVSSWRRSLLSGVDAAGTDLPRDDGATRPDRLVRAAQPVADRLADQLAGMRVWAFLADRECRLVWYVVGEPELAPLLEARGAFPGAWFAEGVVGTNGLGTAVEERRPFIVAGSEHFREYESNATTVGAPVHDPRTGRLVGILNLNCPYERTNGLLLPFVTELARSIEAELRASAPMPEQALLDEFMRTSKRGVRPVVALSQDLFIANAAARTLLRDVDVEPLRHWACDAAAEGRERTATLRMSPTLVVTARCRPISRAHRPSAVVVLAPCTPGSGPATTTPREHLVDALAQAYAARVPLLLRGERGTGKSTLARRVHQQSAPDTPQNLLDAAASIGREDEWLADLRAASTDPAGTVIVRHLDDLPPALASATARALDNARGWLVATATGEHADLAPVFEGFAVVVDVPPLREQTADLPTLIAEIIAELHPRQPRPRVTAEALAMLAGGQWPGNLRQLRQVLATALMRSRSGHITVDDLPGDLATAGPRHLTKLERLERQALVTALRDTAWDREAAAHDLGISRATIYRKLKRFGIQAPAAPGGGPTGVA